CNAFPMVRALSASARRCNENLFRPVGARSRHASSGHARIGRAQRQTAQAGGRGAMSIIMLNDASAPAQLRAGHIMSAFIAVVLLIDAGSKLVSVTAVAEALHQLGVSVSPSLARRLGPLGSSVASQLRGGNAGFTDLLLWGGVYLRDLRLRALDPLR